MPQRGDQRAEKLACPHEYTCSVCHRTFPTEPGWSDADALMEFQDVFSEKVRAVDEEPPVPVCDDCYQRMLAELPPKEFEASL